MSQGEQGASEPSMFGDFPAAVDAAVAKLSKDHSLSRTTLVGLVDRLDIVERQKTQVPKYVDGQQPALVGTFRYVIRNDMILLLSTFLDVIKSSSELIIGILSFQTSDGLAATKSVIDGLVGLYHAIELCVKNGTVLSVADYAIVAMLKRLNRASSSEIAGALQHIDATRRVEAAAVEEILMRYAYSDTNTSGFTKIDKDGSWSLVKV